MQHDTPDFNVCVLYYALFFFFSLDILIHCQGKKSLQTGMNLIIENFKNLMLFFSLKLEIRNFWLRFFFSF